MQNLDNILALVQLSLWINLIIWGVIAIYYTVRLQWMRKNGFLYPTLLALFERRRKPARLVDTNTLPSLTAIRQRSEGPTTPPPLARSSHETQIHVPKDDNADEAVAQDFGIQFPPDDPPPTSPKEVYVTALRTAPDFETQIHADPLPAPQGAHATDDFGTLVRPDTAFDPERTEKLLVPSAPPPKEKQSNVGLGGDTDVLLVPLSAQDTASPQSTPAITMDKMDSKGFHASSPEDADSWNKAWFDSQSLESSQRDED